MMEEQQAEVFLDPDHLSVTVELNSNLADSTG